MLRHDVGHNTYSINKADSHHDLAVNTCMGKHNVAKLRPPTSIKLPDGREIAVKDRLIGPRDRRSYNLQTGTSVVSRTRSKIAKPVDTGRKE